LQTKEVSGRIDRAGQFTVEHAPQARQIRAGRVPGFEKEAE
jgi:hypothetical protein